LTIYGNDYPTGVETRGAILAGDGGGGFWMHSATSTASDNTGTVVDAQGGGKWLRDFDGYTYKPEWFGAVYDDATDSQIAWKATYDAGVAGGKPFRIFVGGMMCVSDLLEINSCPGDICFEGVNKEVSQIRHLTTDKSFIWGVGAGNTGMVNDIAITFKNIGLRGPWRDGTPSAIRGVQAMIRIIGGKRLTFDNVWMRHSQFSALSLLRSQFVCVNSTFEEMPGGAFPVIANCSYIKIDGNVFKHGMDDAIGIHVYSTYMATTPKGLAEEGYNYIITNNYMEDIQGINVLGPRNCIIANNIGHHMKVRFIMLGVDNAYKVGYHTALNCTVENNSCYQLINATFFYGPQTRLGRILFIDAYPPTQSAGGAFPTRPDAAGRILPPYGYMYNNYTSPAGSPIAPTYGIKINNNLYTRTLVVGDYESQTGKKAFNNTGFFTKALTQQDIAETMCGASNSIYGFSFTNNTIQGVQYGLSLTPKAGTPGYMNCRVASNTIMDASSGGIVVLAADIESLIIIENNIIDCDPYFTDPGRNADGSWKTVGEVYGVFCDEVEGLIVQNNHFKNCSRAVYISPTAFGHLRNNYLYGEARALNFSTSNKGIGMVPLDYGGEYVWIGINGDPAQPGYNKLVSGSLSSPAMPTTGFYATGTVIVNNNGNFNIDANNMLLWGWVRKTTGNSHVLGTDWLPMYVSTVSPAV
jgi:hypothetical protein